MVPELSKKVKEEAKGGFKGGAWLRQFHPSAYAGWELIHPVTWV